MIPWQLKMKWCISTLYTSSHNLSLHLLLSRSSNLVAGMIQIYSMADERMHVNHIWNSHRLPLQFVPSFAEQPLRIEDEESTHVVLEARVTYWWKTKPLDRLMLWKQIYIQIWGFLPPSKIKKEKEEKQKTCDKVSRLIPEILWTLGFAANGPGHERDRPYCPFAS